MKAPLLLEISTFSWNLNFLMKSWLWFEISKFSGKIFIFALLPHSNPIDPNTENPAYSAPVDSQTPNSLYSALGEREHKTRARVKMSVLWKNLCLKRDFSKTIDWTQGRQYPKGNALTLEGKLFPCQLNSQTCMRAVNRQPKFTARGTRTALSPRARTGPLWIIKSERPPLAYFYFSMKSVRLHEICIFYEISIFHEI